MRGLKIQDIDLFAINIFPQPRKTFDEENLRELADNISLHGLIHPPTVVVFAKSDKEVGKYLQAVNNRWRARYTRNELKDFDGNYYILIAGERRIRALKILWEDGCSSCQKIRNEKRNSSKDVSCQNGVCYRKHFDNNCVTVSLKSQLSAKQAFELQLAENIQQPVPVTEEAEAYSSFFNFLKEKEEVNLAKFARSVGRSEDTIRNALGFVKLPQKIQEYIKDGHLAYGIGIQLARIQKAKGNEEAVYEWTKNAIVRGFRVSDFERLVSKHLMMEANPRQTSLSEIFEEDASSQHRHSQYKQVLSRGLLQAVYSQIEYLRKVLYFFKEGLLGEADSPFSSTSPLKVFRELVFLQKAVLPHLRRLVKEKEGQKIEKTIHHFSLLIERLEK